MQEVQALCDRVVILNRGKIVANREIALLSDLVTHESCVTIEVKGIKDYRILDRNCSSAMLLYHISRHHIRPPLEMPKKGSSCT